MQRRENTKNNLRLLNGFFVNSQSSLARCAVINHFFGKAAKRLNAVSPFVSVVFIILIVGYILSQDRESIMENWRVLVAAVLLLHVGGFGLGYGLARLFRFDEQSSRTVSIEVGMQNSGLGTELARNHFAALPLAPENFPAAQKEQLTRSSLSYLPGGH